MIGEITLPDTFGQLLETWEPDPSIDSGFPASVVPVTISHLLSSICLPVRSLESQKLVSTTTQFGERHCRPSQRNREAGRNVGSGTQ